MTGFREQLKRLGAAARRLPPRPGPDRLIILDDAFPHLFSAFRIAEYNAYLRSFPSASVFSTGAAFRAFGDRRPFRRVLAEYETRYPEFAGRVSKYRRLGCRRGGLAYTIFLHNIAAFLPAIEKYRLPFVFTLYPGFQMNHAETDALLRRVLSHPGFRKVIVTQPVTQQYLLASASCRPEDIVMVYGGVIAADYFASAALPRKRMGRDKDTFDVCFVGFQYVRGQMFKGYDVFIEAARRLARLDPAFRFHVVGTFGPNDADLEGLEKVIRFHGPQPTSFFPPFYAGMDIILSPNDLPRSLPGAFNGFPTGCCAEAALCGVGVFCTDPLSQNIAFKDREELVIIRRDVSGIVETVEHYRQDYDELCRLADRGREAFRRVFALENQMGPRLNALRPFLQQE